MTDPVRAALGAAALANLPNAQAAGDKPSSTEFRMAANTVAAFLRALPTLCIPTINGVRVAGETTLKALAAAVEAAGTEG